MEQWQKRLIYGGKLELEGLIWGCVAREQDSNLRLVIALPTELPRATRLDLYPRNKPFDFFLSAGAFFATAAFAAALAFSSLMS